MNWNTAQIRSETPGCADKLFFNSAGASLMPQPVLDVMREYLEDELLRGGYKVSETRAAELNEMYTETARLLSCRPENIAFAHSATDAYAKVLSAIDFKAGDLILTSDDDYTSNQIMFLSLQQRLGIQIARMENLPNGDLDLDDFRRRIARKRPKLVAMTQVPNNSGMVQDVTAIGAICREQDITYLVDACQSVGQMVVSVEHIPCDFLTATGRKFLRGPRGTGFLYVSDRMLQQGAAPLFIDGNGATWTDKDRYMIGNTARRFEMFEVPYALKLGLARALRYANELGMANIEAYNARLTGRLRENLRSIAGVETFDRGSEYCNILTFRKHDYTLESIKQHLDLHHVYYSVSTKSWGFIDFSKKGIDWAIRLSPHYFNTIAEIDRVSELIATL